jgi:hypothetical protein
MALVTGFLPRRPGFEPRSGHVGFVVDKVARGQVSSEYFGLLAGIPSARSLTPPQERKRKGV